MPCRPDATIFLETTLPDRDNRVSLLFSAPRRIVACRTPGEVPACLDEIGRAVGEGHYAAGFLSYEAGHAFVPGCGPDAPPSGFPALWFGIYDAPARIPAAAPDPLPFPPAGFSLTGLRPSLDSREYARRVERVKACIERGETYQTNLTFKYLFEFSGSPAALYRRLRYRQRVGYAAFIDTPAFAVASFSPELFFRSRGCRIETRPMKGTASPGTTEEETSRNARRLASCPKNRSENLMIVDLLRNDLSRLPEIERVDTETLFEVEAYETVLQMVSRIAGRTRRPPACRDVFASLFPSGSITGAPKARTMEIIRSLEEEARGIYTGCIGYIGPRDEAVFSVAIRTLSIDKATGRGEMGVGSGIVYDSDPEKEYEECLLKARFLTGPAPSFDIIETMLWQCGRGFFLLPYHLERMASSAHCFGRPFAPQELYDRLRRLARTFATAEDRRVRVLLSEDGALRIEHAPLPPGPRPGGTVRLAGRPTDSADTFLYHKTSRRDLYDGERARARAEGHEDVVFLNERGEVTESSVANIVVLKDGRYLTPPLTAGILPGTYRRHLIEYRQLPLEERILFPRDLRTADRIYLVNSVRRMTEVTLAD